MVNLFNVIIIFHTNNVPLFSPEIYQTERSHVRTLKLLKHLFLFPLQESSLLTQDHLMLLFPPSLSSLCDRSTRCIRAETQTASPRAQLYCK